MGIEAYKNNFYNAFSFAHATQRNIVLGHADRVALCILEATGYTMNYFVVDYFRVVRSLSSHAYGSE